MATRSTTSFLSQGAYLATFYIHHDGYPTNQARRLRSALAALDSSHNNASLADMFFRTQDRAELTRGHDAHSDTDYRYTVHALSDSYAIEVEMRCTDRASGWQRTWYGTLDNFIRGQIGA